MKILLATHDFVTISGAPIWNYELGKTLVARGHTVAIAAQNMRGMMRDKALEAGIETYTWDRCTFRPDVMQVSATGPAWWACNKFDAPAVSTTHSTLIYENPLIHDKIKHYVGVRPQVIQKIVGHDGVDPAKTRLIYNGVDRNRFTPGERDEKYGKPTILFAGTVDYLRAAATHVTNKWALRHGYNVLYVGRKLSGQLEVFPSHVRYLEGDRWDIETLMRQSHMTAGILLGRTTIEGWMCGLPGLCFEIDNDGNIVEQGVYDPPHPQLLEIFDIEHMATEYLRLYEAA